MINIYFNLWFSHACMFCICIANLMVSLVEILLNRFWYSNDKIVLVYWNMVGLYDEWNFGGVSFLSVFTEHPSVFHFIRRSRELKTPLEWCAWNAVNCSHSWLPLAQIQTPLISPLEQRCLCCLSGGQSWDFAFHPF